jgi:hypothetical protein
MTAQTRFVFESSPCSDLCCTALVPVHTAVMTDVQSMGLPTALVGGETLALPNAEQQASAMSTGE